MQNTTQLKMYVMSVFIAQQSIILLPSQIILMVSFREELHQENDNIFFAIFIKQDNKKYNRYQANKPW